MPKFPESVRIVEVGPRDGLQNVKRFISTKEKIQYIDLLSQAKMQEIEVTSFVSPKWVPQLSDGVEVSSSILKRKLTIYTALVPNLNGLEKAIESGFKSVAIFVAASESFSKKNINCSIEESIQRLREMQQLWKEEDLRVRGYISTCWHCPYEGKVESKVVEKVVEQLFDLGIDEISLGDTIGKAEPNEVKELLDLLLKRFSVNDFALHMHDTYQKAVSNIEVGLEFGIRVYDSSAGGVGGCPFAPNAGGNIASELLVQFLETKNVKTYIDYDKLFEASQFIRDVIKGKNGTNTIAN